ncbi:MAG: carboxypeptidase regulatory-like domain-containing protein [Acidobacteriota bacterium]
MGARTLVAVFATAIAVLAQPAPRIPPTSRMEGRVVTDREGTPLRRVRLILHPLESADPAMAVETDDQGTFVIRDIKPGPYALTAIRDGYLESTTFRLGKTRMPRQFTLNGGERMTNLEFRLQRWSVVSGRIRYEDGEPAVNMPVTLYREYHVRGRHGLQSAATALTNDRGEFRAHGLTAGLYYLAAVVDSAQTAQKIENQSRRDDSGREVPVRTYATMFYPDTTRLSEAVPIRLSAGDDLTGIDLYMQQVQRVKLSGVVSDGATGGTLSGASIILERADSTSTGTLPAPAKVEFDEESRFHIANVVPGRYQVWVDVTNKDGKRLVGRSTLLVTNADVEDLNLSAMPQIQWSGELTYPPGTRPAARTFSPKVVLEPRSERGAIVNAVLKNGRLDVNLMPNETYDVLVDNLPDGYFISQIRVGGGDVKTAGLMSSMASNIPFQIVADSRGGRIDGQVLGSTGDPWAGANLSLIPESTTARLQDYRDGYADTTGQFHITGVAPGRYILSAWFDQPPCDIYDPTTPTALDACRASGAVFNMQQGAVQTVSLTMKVP